VPEPSAASVAIVTLGCGRNEVDSDQLAGHLVQAGLPVVAEAADAEVVLVNTCTFIGPAKQESIDTILAAVELKETGSARAVVVVGCMAQRYPQELAEAIPEADAVVGFDGYAVLPAVVADVLAGRTPGRVLGVDPPAATVPTGRALPLVTSAERATARSGSVLGLGVAELPDGAVPFGPASGTAQDTLDRIPATGPRFPVRRHDGRPWAYLKIASGCDRLCTFCAIPSFRGRFRSRPLDELVAEAAWLAEQGARELVLVSENTTSWGKDLPGGRDGQAQLLRELAQVDGLERLRLMYLQPAELTWPLLETLLAEPKVASYLDLSLQHVSAPVVRRMARSGDHVRFGELIRRIRALDPHAVFRSNFILGFPGETEHDVDVLEAFLEEHRLDWVGLFPFSREDGTPSDLLPDQVPEEVAAARVARIAAAQELLADEAARRFVGRDLAVTVEATAGQDPDGLTVGRSYREAPDTDGEVVLVAAGTGGVDGIPADLPVGRTVTARVVATAGVDLVAEVAAAPHARDGRPHGQPLAVPVGSGGARG
jgi:ribosomal protein S12 methylthiotransferase